MKAQEPGLLEERQKGVDKTVQESPVFRGRWNGLPKQLQQDWPRDRQERKRAERRMSREKHTTPADLNKRDSYLHQKDSQKLPFLSMHCQGHYSDCTSEW